VLGEERRIYHLFPPGGYWILSVRGSVVIVVDYRPLSAGPGFEGKVGYVRDKVPFGRPLDEPLLDIDQEKDIRRGGFG
jgi:hypothetical protein